MGGIDVFRSSVGFVGFLRDCSGRRWDSRVESGFVYLECFVASAVAGSLRMDVYFLLFMLL